MQDGQQRVRSEQVGRRACAESWNEHRLTPTSGKATHMHTADPGLTVSHLWTKQIGAYEAPPEREPWTQRQHSASNASRARQTANARSLHEGQTRAPCASASQHFQYKMWRIKLVKHS